MAVPEWADTAPQAEELPTRAPSRRHFAHAWTARGRPRCRLHSIHPLNGVRCAPCTSVQSVTARGFDIDV